MSGYYDRNNRGITKKLGPVTAYADAVLAGYNGTREQWAQDMAGLGQNVTQVAQNTKLTTELAEQTRTNTEQVAKDTADVRRLAEETSDNAVQVASNTAESNRLAEETKQAAARAKADAEFAGSAADNFRVDTTLSEEGKAAEAKTTGEKFAQITEDIEDISDDLQKLDGYLPVKWELGGIGINSDGTLYYADNAPRIRSKSITKVLKDTKISLTSYELYYLVMYLSTDGLVFDTQTQTVDVHRPYYDFPEDMYCAFVIVRKDSSAQEDLSATSLFSIDYKSVIDDIKTRLTDVEAESSESHEKVNQITNDYEKMIGGKRTFTTVSNKTTSYKYPIVKGHLYKFINLAESTCTMNVYAGKSETIDTSNEIMRSVGKGYIREYLADADYDYIYVYATETADFTIEDIDGLSFMMEEIPVYYKEHIEQKIAEINALDSDCGLHGDSFVFMTDYHRQANAENSNRLIKKILDNTSARFFLFGGDVQDSEDSKTGGLEQIQLFKDKFKNVSYDMLSLIGNHEFNPYTMDDTAGQYMLTYDHVYRLTVKDKEHLYGGISDYGNYWFDNAAQKIRYICTTTDGFCVMGNNSVKWVLNAIKDTPAGYSIVVLSHLTFDVSSVDNTKVYLRTGICWIAEAMDKYNERGTYTFDGTDFDFSNCGATALCVIGGHTHYDMDSSRESDFLLPEWFNTMPDVMVVATTTDAYFRQNKRVNVIARNVSTVTEQAFDYVAIDTKNKILDMIRIGAGHNRRYHLETITEPITLIAKASNVTWDTSNSAVASVSDGTLTRIGSGRAYITATDADGNVEVWRIKV